MKWLFQRLAEPSTWAGLGLALTQILPILSAGHVTAAGAGVIAAGIAGALIPEKSV